MMLPGILVSVVAFFFVQHLKGKLARERVGADLFKSKGIGGKLDGLSLQIKEGARAFLVEEYRWLAYFVAGMAIILVILFTVDYDEDKADATQGVRTAAAFVVGAALSAGAGWGGMMVATDGNVRTTVACAERDLNAGLQVAFNTGAIMGFTVVGLGLLGLSLMLLIVGAGYGPAATMQVLPVMG